MLWLNNKIHWADARIKLNTLNKAIVQDFKYKGKFKPEGKFIAKTVTLMLQCLKISRGHLYWQIHKSNDKRQQELKANLCITERSQK